MSNLIKPMSVTFFSFITIEFKYHKFLFLTLYTHLFSPPFLSFSPLLFKVSHPGYILPLVVSVTMGVLFAFVVFLFLNKWKKTKDGELSYSPILINIQ